jgi:hypothetical protein
MARKYIVVEMGCLCCGDTSRVVGMFDDEVVATTLRERLQRTYGCSTINFVLGVVESDQMNTVLIPEYQTAGVEKIKNRDKERYCNVEYLPDFLTSAEATSLEADCYAHFPVKLPQNKRLKRSYGLKGFVLYCGISW